MAFNQSQIKGLTVDTVANAANKGGTGQVTWIRELKGFFEYVVDNTLVADGLDIVAAQGTNSFWVRKPAPVQVFDLNKATHGLTVGTPITPSGDAALADDGSTTSIGVVTEVVDADNVKYAIIGSLELNAGDWTALSDDTEELQPGLTYYVSASNAGKVTKTKPSAPNYDNPVGIALTATEMLLVPYKATQIKVESDAARTYVVVNQTGHGFVVGQPIRPTAMDTYEAAVAEEGKESSAIVTKVVDADNFEATIAGLVEVPSHGFTDGETYWLPETAGVAALQPQLVIQSLFTVVDDDTLQVYDRQAVLSNGGIETVALNHVTFGLLNDADGTICPFDESQGDTDVITNSAGTITIPPGKYKITASCTRHSNILDYSLYNVTDSVVLERYTSSADGILAVSKPYYLTTDKTLQIRVEEGNNDFSATWNGRDNGSNNHPNAIKPWACWIDIEQLPNRNTVLSKNEIPVDITGMTDGDILEYDLANRKFKKQAITVVEGAPAATEIVNITNPVAFSISDDITLPGSVNYTIQESSLYYVQIGKIRHYSFRLYTRSSAEIDLQFTGGVDIFGAIGSCFDTTSSSEAERMMGVTRVAPNTLRLNRDDSVGGTTFTEVRVSVVMA